MRSGKVFHLHRRLDGKFRSKHGGNISMMASLMWITWLACFLDNDFLPEWSKGVDPSSTSAG